MTNAHPICRGVAFVVFAGALAMGCGGDEGQPGPTTLGTNAGAATPDPDAGADGGGKKKPGDQGCNADAECETNLCFKGNMQSFCTLTCTTANAQTICLAPLTGTCNKQGYCKRD